MKSAVYAIAAIATLISPCAAIGKEVRVRCDMLKSRAYTNSAKLNDTLNAQQQTSIRHYIFDDATRRVWLVANGVRQPICNTGQNCTLSYTAESIVFADNIYPLAPNRTTIDRLAGTIEHQADTFNSQGNLLFRFIFSGKCYPESVTNRKF
ncbi:hypothetical protein [Sphingomonas sp. IC081]|uniref:hypothetical protein n=1 Tax=Sphingomonas sp. IC081 TaxID=304378 RepID=UPI00115B5C24|nr:hypothetical protein [Sphingomonas sp. IC081]